MIKVILFASLIFYGCNKEKSNCYKCTVEPYSGQATEYEKVCTDRIDTVQFRTIDGRPLAHTCEPFK